jgi:hypothetical protein
VVEKIKRRCPARYGYGVVMVYQSTTRVVVDWCDCGKMAARMPLVPVLSAEGGQMKFVVGKLQGQKLPGRAIFDRARD